MVEPAPPALPSELSVLPLRRTVAFPLTLQPLAVNRAVSIESVNRALGSDRLGLVGVEQFRNQGPGPRRLPRLRTGRIGRQMAQAAGGVEIHIRRQAGG